MDTNQNKKTMAFELHLDELKAFNKIRGYESKSSALRRAVKLWIKNNGSDELRVTHP